MPGLLWESTHVEESILDDEPSSPEECKVDEEDFCQDRSCRQLIGIGD
ncbi:hypothetical protein N9C83_05415 [Opitutales bacterium]|nr:hypothetical protein [Opitutales bacterium]